MTKQQVKTTEEYAAEVAANAPPLTTAQRVRLRQIFGSIPSEPVQVLEAA